MNRSRLFCVLVALFSWCAVAEANEDALAVIRKSADAVFKSDTLYFERVSASPKVKGKSMAFKDRYYLQNNPDGTFNAFFQQTLFTSNVIVTNIDTMYLKNAEGLWELYPALAINISSFAKD